MGAGQRPGVERKRKRDGRTDREITAACCIQETAHSIVLLSQLNCQADSASSQFMLTCPDSPAILCCYTYPAHVMLPRIIPQNFLRLHTRRNKKETANNGARHSGTICVGAKCSFTLTRGSLRRIAQIFVYRSIGLVVCETNQIS